MRLNSEAFNWHSRMPPIFEEHEEIIGTSKRQAENALKVTSLFYGTLFLTPFKICHLRSIFSSTQPRQGCSAVNSAIVSKIVDKILTCSTIQLRRERFEEELQGYHKQLEEFETFGDVAEVNRYLKKAQTLNSRLEQAQEKVLQQTSLNI